MKPQKILFIGGPGTGKTSVIDLLRQKGHACLKEISRETTLEAKKKGIDQLFLSDPLVFSSLLLKGRIKQFEEAEKCQGKNIFIDRGIPDISAYLDYAKHPTPKAFLKANLDFRYDKIFLFPFWMEIYLSDNERYETSRQAQNIQEHLVATYEKLGYDLINTPKTSVKGRVDFILKHCNA